MDAKIHSKTGKATVNRVGHTSHPNYGANDKAMVRGQKEGSDLRPR